MRFAAQEPITGDPLQSCEGNDRSSLTTLECLRASQIDGGLSSVSGWQDESGQRVVLACLPCLPHTKNDIILASRKDFSSTEWSSKLARHCDLDPPSELQYASKACFKPH